LFSNLFEDRPLARRNKVGSDVTVQIRYLTHVWRFVEIESPCFFLEESSFRYGRESVQSMTTCGKHVGGDDRNAGRIESTRDSCTRWAAAAKPRFHRKIKTFLKRLDILMITFELHVRNVFRVPKLNL